MQQEMFERIIQTEPNEFTRFQFLEFQTHSYLPLPRRYIRYMYFRHLLIVL